jgi:multiple sugar transport system ATP-binding protein
MITVRAGGGMVSAKTHKEYRAQIGEPVGIRVPAAVCHLFDRESGERIGHA